MALKTGNDVCSLLHNILLVSLLSVVSGCILSEFNFINNSESSGCFYPFCSDGTTTIRHEVFSFDPTTPLYVSMVAHSKNLAKGDDGFGSKHSILNSLSELGRHQQCLWFAGAVVQSRLIRVP